MNTETQERGYHAVIRHQFVDRQGFEPTLIGRGDDRRDVTARLEAEHDWVLLLFARSPNLRHGAEKALSRLNGPHAYLADRGDTEAAILHHRQQVARALCGLDYDANAVGYITMNDALHILAGASHGYFALFG